jgi:hypothetical protein
VNEARTQLLMGYPTFDEVKGIKVEEGRILVSEKLRYK